jgi:micrococcal nuclease
VSVPRARRRGTILAAIAALPLAAACTLAAWNAVPASAAMVLSPDDTEEAQFAACVGSHRITCVVDGDTFWYNAVKIRIADINTPEVSEPQCAYEARLGAQATERLTELLNAGPFSLWPVERAYDKYHRRLLVVKRGGHSLGDTLVAEGLAERWQGYRRNWCNG